jgi:hypothetical protein
VTEARELRFAVTFEDYDATVRLFRDVFGLRTLMDLEEQGGRGVILSVPSATPTGGRDRSWGIHRRQGSGSPCPWTSSDPPPRRWPAPEPSPWPSRSWPMWDRNQRFRLTERLTHLLERPEA